MKRLSLLAAAMVFASAAFAQYPNKPIRLVVPFPAGSATDTVARILGQSVSTAVGQPVLVDNKVGADGAIAGAEVAKAAPDGYTLFLATNSPMAVAPAMKKVPPYDPGADFTPIADIGRYTFFLYINAETPIKSFKELVTYAKANPGKLNYATGNTTGIMSFAQMNALAGIDMTHVPYKGEPISRRARACCPTCRPWPKSASPSTRSFPGPRSMAPARCRASCSSACTRSSPTR